MTWDVPELADLQRHSLVPVGRDDENHVWVSAP